MKAISLPQPYAMLVALGFQHYNVRRWTTGHRGLIAIHAAYGVTKDDERFAQKVEVSTALKHGGYNTFQDLPRGHIVGCARLETVYPVSCFHGASGLPLSWLDLATNDWSDPKAYAFHFQATKPLKAPMKVRGQKGLWEWDDVFQPEAAHRLSSISSLPFLQATESF